MSPATFPLRHVLWWGHASRGMHCSSDMVLRAAPPPQRSPSACGSAKLSRPWRPLRRGRAQDWEAVPANSQGGFTFGAVITSSDTNFVPTSVQVAGEACAVMSG